MARLKPQKNMRYSILRENEGGRHSNVKFRPKIFVAAKPRDTLLLCCTPFFAKRVLYTNI